MKGRDHVEVLDAGGSISRSCFTFP